MRLIDAEGVYKILESCEIRKATIGNPLTDWEYGYTCGIERAESEIECAPTVDAIPVEWIKKYAEEHRAYIHEFRNMLVEWAERKEEWCCSACGEIEHTEGSWEHPLKDREWKYCRTCGAKMYETQKKPCDDCQEFDCYGCEYAEEEDGE